MGVSRAELKSFTLNEVRKYPKSDRLSIASSVYGLYSHGYDFKVKTEKDHVIVKRVDNPVIKHRI